MNTIGWLAHPLRTTQKQHMKSCSHPHYANEAYLERCIVGWRGLAESGVQDFGGPCIATKAHQLDVMVVDDGVHSAMEYMHGAHGRPHHHSRQSAAAAAGMSPADLDDSPCYDLLCYSEHDNWPVYRGFFDRACAMADGRIPEMC